MKIIVLAGLLAAGVAATNAPTEVQRPVEMSLKQRVARTILPEVRTDSAEPQKVVEWLRVESKKYTPDKTEINFVWQVPADAKLRPVSLNLVKLPLNDVLSYFTAAAGLRYRVERHAVVIYVPETVSTDAKSK